MKNLIGIIFILPFAVLHWLLFMVAQLFGFITAPVLFPVAFLLENWIYKTNNFIGGFLYLYLDTLEPYADKFWRKANGYPEDIEEVKKLPGLKKFWLRYKWTAIRNPFWNFNYLVRTPDLSNPETIIKINFYTTLGRLYNYRSISYDTTSLMAVLKYVDKDGKYLNNKGEFISGKFSLFGWTLNVYSYKWLPYFNFSYAGKFLGTYKEVQIGMNNYRYTFRLKPYLFRQIEIFEER